MDLCIPKAAQCLDPAATPVPRRREAWQPSTQAGASQSTIGSSPQNSGVANVSREDTGPGNLAAVVQCTWSFEIEWAHCYGVCVCGGARPRAPSVGVPACVRASVRVRVLRCVHVYVCVCVCACCCD